MSDISAVRVPDIFEHDCMARQRCVAILAKHPALAKDPKDTEIADDVMVGCDVAQYHPFGRPYLLSSPWLANRTGKDARDWLAVLLEKRDQRVEEAQPVTLAQPHG
jgi:hypothetical protein